MATSLYTIDVSSTDGETPVSADKHRSLVNLRNMLYACLAGNARGVHTFSCRTAAAKAAAVVTCAAVANADTVTVNGTALTATQHHARGTITPTLSGVDVTDTVTINTTGILTARQHYATGTVTITAAGVDNDDTVTINGVDFTAAAAEDLEAGEFDISGTDTAAATSLAACINASEDEDIVGVVTATSAAGVVTVRAVATGVAGNALTFVSSDAQLAVTGSGFLAGATAVAADEFDISGTTAQACTSLAAAINACTALSGIVTATTSATVVTVRAVTAGAGGNSIGLASSDAQLAVSAATLTGGATVTNNTFDFGGSDTQTATALVTAINASSTALVSGQVLATNAAGVVTLTAIIPGRAGNAITIATSNGTRLAITGSVARLAGGTETLITHTF
jgi:hypothetical protein